MQFIDLAVQQQKIRQNLEDRIRAVLDHGQYIMGPEVQLLEEKLSAYVGARHAVSCASGTDALLMALMAWGVGPGDAVFTTPFTFMATAEVVSLLGATPIFVDCDAATFNLDPEHLRRAVEALQENDPSAYPLPRASSRKGLRPRAVIAVDLFGLPADYGRINGIAKDHELVVIQDAAQSFGAERDGAKAGAMAEIGCTSFFPAKPLGAYGDGGMCFTGNDGLAEVMRSIRVHGQGADKYENVRIGINGRLDTLQAAILLAKLDLFPGEVVLRQQVADRYTALLGRGASPVVAPVIPRGCVSAWAQYSVLCKEQKDRPALLAKLKEAKVPTAIYYPRPLHLQAAFAYLGYEEGDFPVSEDFARRIFSLPMHPYLTVEDQERIAGILLAGG